MPLIIAFLTIAAFCLGYVTSDHKPEPKPLKLEGTTLCFYGRYDSLKEWDATAGVAKTVVDVGARGVTVYVPCPVNNTM